MRKVITPDGKRLNEDLIFGEVRDKADLKKINMVPTDSLQCRVRFSGRHVISKAKFYPGDIIEVCPTRKVTSNALYSREVRDMAFEVAPGEYVIPLGYCQFYDIVDRQNPEANCIWEWNKRTKCIIIRALEIIPKDTVLVLDLEQ